MNEKEKKAIRDLIDSSNLSRIGDGTVITSNKTINTILNLIEKTTKENEELRKELNEENKRCMMLAVEKQDYFEKYKYHLQQNESLTREFSNYIPVQKVKDKIEELKQEKKKYGNCLIEMYENELVNRDIKILQELIEEKGE